MPSFPWSNKWSVFASLSLAAAVTSNPCFADQWPSHPLPTKSTEAAVYGRAIGIRPSLGACLKETDGTMPSIRDCLRDEHGFQDHRLNQTYKKLMGSLSEAERKHLREEERRWMTFRDTFCAPDPEPGQVQELEADECVVDQTADRASELESRLNLASIAFAGHWLYTQTCGYEHSVDLALDQKGADVTGRWAEGTRLNGSFGSLKGRVHDGKLFMRYCEGDERAGYMKCPGYAPESTDYFIRKGKDLIRYKGAGMGAARTFEQDVVLHQAINEKPPITDDHCADDDR